MSIHHKSMTEKRYTSAVLGVIILLFLAGCSSNISLIDSDSSAASAESAPAAANQVSIPASLTDEQAVLIDLYKRVNPSVVNIAAYGGQPGFPEPGGPPGPPGPSQGSGFVYDQAGYLVTNAHVVAGANQIEITFANGTISEAAIVGLDPDSDLAALKVAQLPAGASALPLGNMNELAVGQTVVAIGNPFGLEGTLTRGIISALGRTIPALTPFSIPHAIQTDAAPGPDNPARP